MSTSASLDHQSKRVIPRLRVSDFEGHVPSGYYDATKAYLTFAGRPTSELEEKRHYVHIEPFQDPELRQTSFHITLDMEKDMLDDARVFGICLMRSTVFAVTNRVSCEG
ncbi:MAG: hypothetical protein M1840_006982 [Geoglossum simile]|nr:MAG: hypothetical protein M1840_006982 [Geoglossum simile]